MGIAHVASVAGEDVQIGAVCAELGSAGPKRAVDGGMGASW